MVRIVAGIDEAGVGEGEKVVVVEASVGASMLPAVAAPPPPTRVTVATAVRTAVDAGVVASAINVVAVLVHVDVVMSPAARVLGSADLVAVYVMVTVAVAPPGPYE
jgi:hypothetical protein